MRLKIIRLLVKYSLVTAGFPLAHSRNG